RLRFEPTATDELTELVNRNPASGAVAASLKPLVDDLTDARLRLFSTTTTTATTAAARAEAASTLRLLARSLAPAQRRALAAIPSVDDDGDGLTNTEEMMWCTDPGNPDTDGDGVNDGAEVQLLKDWMANRRSGPPSSGPPFKGWPMVPGDAA